MTTTEIDLEHWEVHAVCRDADPALFFPARGESTRPAIDLCATCPVARPCMAVALDTPVHSDHGIWGGDERTGPSGAAHVALASDGAWSGAVGVPGCEGAGGCCCGARVGR